MNITELIKGVQSHFASYEASFKDRIEDAIPVAVEMFGSEHQWEFLDAYTTTTAATDATSGKDYITRPDDFFKPVFIWCNRSEVKYIDRKEWGERQMQNLSAQEPHAYTVIGRKLFLDRPSDGSTIEMVYTKTANNVSVTDLDDQYHTVILAAIIWYLTPATSGPSLVNPAKEVAWQAYMERVNVAMSQEQSVKGRVMRFRPDPVAQRRSQYR